MEKRGDKKNRKRLCQSNVKWDGFQPLTAMKHLRLSTVLNIGHSSTVNCDDCGSGQSFHHVLGIARDRLAPNRFPLKRGIGWYRGTHGYPNRLAGPSQPAAGPLMFVEDVEGFGIFHPIVGGQPIALPCAAAPGDQQLGQPVIPEKIGDILMLDTMVNNET